MEAELHSERYAVAFVDLLGASEAIKNDTKDTNLNTVNNLLTFAINLCTKNDKVFGKFEIKVFSDNIIVARSLVNHSILEEKKIIHDLFSIVSLFQFYASSNGILIRGGITIGDLYIDDRFVWGKALLRAYQLENKLAIYPRIAVDKCVYDIMKFDENGELCHCHILMDLDAVNYLDYCSFIGSSSIKQYLEEIKQTIDRMKILLASDEKALQKVAWQESYLKQVEDNLKAE